MKTKKIFIVFLLMCAILATSCGGREEVTGLKHVKNENNFEYTRLTIEGMPCILYKYSAGIERGYGGLTCDWDKLESH